MVLAEQGELESLLRVAAHHGIDSETPPQSAPKSEPVPSAPEKRIAGAALGLSSFIAAGVASRPAPSGLANKSQGKQVRPTLSASGFASHSA
jgi:hypothetical protein